jgi:hypothetical protein
MGVSPPLLFDDSFLSFEEKMSQSFADFGENILKFSPTLEVNIFQSFIRFWEKTFQNFSDSWKKMP